VNVLGIFCSFMLVLVLLYPEQGLLGVLSGGDDVVTIRYREALLRVRPDDTPLRLNLAGSLVRTDSYARALEVLSAVPTGLTAEQRRLVAELRYAATRSLFASAPGGGAEWVRLRPLFLAAARELAGPKPPVWRLREFAADARKAGDLDAWHDFSRLAETAVAPAAESAETPDYRGRAARFFALMAQADTLGKRRELFFSAVRTLQAGNLPVEAFDAGERHLDSLATDRKTLIFLTRVGLAAGQPERAQRLIKRALGMDDSRQEPGAS
jgi:hypothetical protein